MKAVLRSWLDLRNSPNGLAPALIISLIAFFQIFDTQAFILAGPDIVRKFDLNIRTVVTITQFVGFVSIFAGLGLGWYGDRHRRLPIFVGATAVSGVAAMTTAAAHSTLTLGTPRVVDDASNIGGETQGVSLMADYYPTEARGRAYAMVGALRSAGELLALPSAGFLITTFGLRTTFVVFGAPIVAMAVVALVWLREPVRGYFERKELGAGEEVALKEDEPRSFGEAWRAAWAVRTLRRMFVSVMLTFAGLVAFRAYFGFFLFEKYGLNAGERGVVGTPAVAATLLGGFVAGALVDRFSVARPNRVVNVFATFLTISAVGLLFIAWAPALPVVILGACLFGFGLALLGPAFFAVFSQVVPANVRTQALQMTSLAVLPSLIFMTPISIGLQEQNGYPAVFLFSVPFLLLAALVSITAGPSFAVDRANASAQAMASEEWRRARASGKSKLLVSRAVDVSYGAVQVLFGVDFDVEEGEIIALLGTNGAGKSTLLRAISGSQEASGGAIVFDGRDITHMPPHEVTARGVVHMPGGRGVFPGLSVRENLALGGWLAEDADIEPGLAEVYEIFPVLAERGDTLAGALSGGEQQQLSLAQAFLSNPKLLLIDELSLGLAPTVVGQLLDAVREIHRRGVTVVVVEQSVNVALQLADRAIFMEKGEVRFFGLTADLLRRPDILRAVYVKGTAGVGARGPAQRKASDVATRPILEVEGLTKRYGGVTALDDLSLTVAESSVLGIIGPNGSGKTTLFDIVSGFLRPDAGRVHLQGVDVTTASPETRARRHLLRRFQDAALFPSLTVQENVLVALQSQLEVKSVVLSAVQAGRARRAERQIRLRADGLLELLQLGRYRDTFARDLSTGLRRIVDLACVLAASPEVLLLDEPSSGIAQAEAQALAPLLRRVRYETGCTLVIIEHDMALLSSVADELVALDRGAFVCRGAPAEVLEDERVVASYLGGSDDSFLTRAGR
jgi:ABC-type branched-subunit amino acid transport system ATPase component/predicted MFS family arabinose efflux permease